ncbi:ornithine cyclodeaminase family protein, partial [Candidatus Bathyarchaeota archaeon]
MAEAIRVVEEALREQAQGKAAIPKRLILHPCQGKGWFAVMPGYLEASGTLAVKAVSSYPGDVEKGLPTIHALTLYFNHETGAPLALLEAGYLTALRTGAIGAVAAKHLALEAAERLGLLGSGEQAWSQLEAHLQVLKNLKEVKVYSPNPSHREAFAQKASKVFSVNVKPVSSPREAVEGC